jgi:hypothetical protein
MTTTTTTNTGVDREEDERRGTGFVAVMKSQHGSKFAACPCGRTFVLMYRRGESFPGPSCSNGPSSDRFTYHDTPDGHSCPHGGALLADVGGAEEACHGEGEQQAECEDCHVRLTTANQDAQEPERCNICGRRAREEYGPANEQHEHIFAPMTADSRRHPRRSCRCGRVEVWASAGPPRSRTAAWREARGDGERANLKPAGPRAWWAKRRSFMRPVPQP